LALLAAGGHVVDLFVEVVGDAFFVEKEADALGVGEGGGGGE
jgi:hypothetical protein